jgi:tRNA(Arg) A34 adenosine deaminase TadA
MTDEALLLEAIRLAAEHSADGRNGPFGAVIARAGTVVGRGWNRVVADADPTAHAEVAAIRDACRRVGTHVLADCAIYCSCEPCPMCLAAIYWARIPRVVFAATSEDARAAGFDDRRIHVELTRPWGERRLDAERLPLPEGLEVLRRWQRNPDRVDY